MRHGALLLLIGWAALAFTIAVLPGVSARRGLARAAGAAAAAVAD